MLPAGQRHTNIGTYGSAELCSTASAIRVPTASTPVRPPTEQIDCRTPIVESDPAKIRRQVNADEIFRADQQASLPQRVL